MDYGPRRPQNIDGIFRGQRPNTPRPLPRRLPSSEYLRQRPAPTPPSFSRSLIAAKPGQPSLLNTSLPPRTSSGQPLFNPTGPLASATPVKKKARWSRKRKVAMAMLTILFVGFGFGTWYGSRIIGNIDKVLHGNVFSDAQALFSNTQLKGEAQGRVNILLAGDSADDPNHSGAQLTDSIMVVSIDTTNHTGFMLSIPRDLWVDIPGWSHQKINAANEVTQFNKTGFPSGGMGMLENIVQTDLGIPIDYYGLIDYTAFKDAVNAVGGITINIQSPDPRGIYDAYTSLKLSNGSQTLDGQQALNLARARGDNAAGDVSYGLPNSDFDRTQHQRQMLVALAQKSQSIGVIANPIKVTQLFDAFGNNVKTDLTLTDALRFIQITKGINISNLKSVTYQYGGTNGLLRGYVDPSSGQDALIPTAGIDNFGQLKQFYLRLTSSSPVVQEAPSVVILNANNSVGLAHNEEVAIQPKGFDVVSIGDAYNEYPGTMVVDNTKGQKPASLQLLQQLFPGTVAKSTTGSKEAAEAAGYSADFVVILGQNWNSAPHT